MVWIPTVDAERERATARVTAMSLRRVPDYESATRIKASPKMGVWNSQYDADRCDEENGFGGEFISRDFLSSLDVSAR